MCIKTLKIKIFFIDILEIIWTSQRNVFINTTKKIVNLKNAQICYIHVMLNRLLGLPQQRKLKRLVVPNLKLPVLNSDEDYTERAEIRKISRLFWNDTDYCDAALQSIIGKTR